MPDAISRFRTGYVAAFGPAGDDPLYESVSAGRKAQGMEHWLPLFYERLDTLFDYLPRVLILWAIRRKKQRTRAWSLLPIVMRRANSSASGPGRQEAIKAAALQAAEAGSALSDGRRMERRRWRRHIGARSDALPGTGKQD